MSRRFPPDRQRARARDTREFGAPRGRALKRRSSDFWATIRRRFAPLAGGTNLRELEIGLPGVHKGAVLNGLGIKSPLTAADADPTGRSLVAACSAWVPGTQVGDRRPGGRIFSSDSALACRCPVHTVYSLSPQLTRPGSASASPRAPLRPSPTGSTGVVQGRGSSTNPSSWRARNRAHASGFRRAARHAGLLPPGPDELPPPIVGGKRADRRARAVTRGVAPACPIGQPACHVSRAGDVLTPGRA